MSQDGNLYVANTQVLTEREVQERMTKAHLRSYSGLGADAVGQAQAGDMAENAHAKNLMRRIKSDPTLQLDESDLMFDVPGAASRRRMLTEKMPVQNTAIPQSDLAVLAKYGIQLDSSAPVDHQPSMLAEDDLSMLLPEEQASVLAARRQRQVQQPQRRVQQPQPGRQMLTDAAPAAPAPGRQMLNERSPAPAKTWVVKQFVGETASGASVPVWKVINSATKFSMDKLFRVESVANKIAYVLNETGNVNDQRIVNIITAYDRRNQLLKEIRNMEAQGSQNPAQVQRLQQLRGHLAQIDYKLGI